MAGYVERAAVLRDGKIVGMFHPSDVVRLEQLFDTLDEAERRGLEA